MPRLSIRAEVCLVKKYTPIALMKINIIHSIKVIESLFVLGLNLKVKKQINREKNRCSER
jgi:hypothetical protein